MSKLPYAESQEGRLADILTSSFKSQYHAVLATLRDAIECCPEGEWAVTNADAPFWRVCYHALYYTHLYLQPHDTDFCPWERHQTGLQHLDDVPAPPELETLLELPNRPPQTGVPLSKRDVLAYWTFCDAMVDDAVDSLDLTSPTTGFRWHTPARPKVEHQISNIRHIQHHASQLALRVRATTGEGVEWVGSMRPEPT